MELWLKNIRCFSGKIQVPIRPLTIIVGENSSGKSTLLATIAAVSNTGKFPGSPGFNRPPFFFGGFNEIASANEKGSGKKAVEFGVGFKTAYTDEESGKDRSLEVFASYRDDVGRPLIRLLSVKSDFLEINLKRTLKTDELKVTVNLDQKDIDSSNKTLNFRLQNTGKSTISEMSFPSLSSLLINDLFHRVDEESLNKDRNRRKELSNIRLLTSMLQIAGQVQNVWGNVKSLSPIRTKPKRTYDVVEDIYNPEGEHIPYRLRRASTEALEKISEFGRQSGLFEDVQIRKLGPESSAPFQILVSIAGEKINIADVGYGVSQSLPIVAETLLSSPGSTMLIQQPEVHLHPKAQAALGTFFSRLVSTGNYKFVLETHSDYLLDRVRQEVANGTIKSSDVGLIFTERNELRSKIHQIQIDEMGNIISPPDAYRQFFLEEEMRLLQRGDES